MTTGDRQGASRPRTTAGAAARGAGSRACAAPSAGATCGPRIDAATLERLARVARALADPIRLGMLDVMLQGRERCGVIDPAECGVPGSTEPDGICVCEFQRQFGLAQSTASYHLRVLRDAGLVTEEARGKWSFYTVDGRSMADALRALQRALAPGVASGAAGHGRPRT